jgi:hypothetical protein
LYELLTICPTNIKQSKPVLEVTVSSTKDNYDKITVCKILVIPSNYNL